MGEQFEWVVVGGGVTAGQTAPALADRAEQKRIDTLSFRIVAAADPLVQLSNI